MFNPTKQPQFVKTSSSTFYVIQSSRYKTTRIKGAKMVINDVACIDIDFGWFWLIV